jgi:hypothetical protein
MPGTTHYTIRPVSVGALTIGKSYLVFGVGYGEMIDSVVDMWYVEGEGSVSWWTPAVATPSGPQDTTIP